MSGGFRAGKTIIVATANSGKVREFAHAFGELGCDVKSLADFPPMPAVAETGETFMENAELKARAVAERLGLACVADDSGLRVKALGGEPGVRSARYAGEPASDKANIVKLLAELEKRAGAFTPPPGLPLQPGMRLLSEAEFVAALVYFDPADGTLIRAEGTCPGYIADRPRGDNGFGYDPLFYVPEYGRTMAELSIDEKQAISHRGRAIRLLVTLMSRIPGTP
jgi:XTP/dITP diphosphohydrolase